MAIVRNLELKLHQEVDRVEAQLGRSIDNFNYNDKED